MYEENIKRTCLILSKTFNDYGNVSFGYAILTGFAKKVQYSPTTTMYDSIVEAQGLERINEFRSELIASSLLWRLRWIEATSSKLTFFSRDYTAEEALNIISDNNWIDRINAAAKVNGKLTELHTYMRLNKRKRALTLFEWAPFIDDNLYLSVCDRFDVPGREQVFSVLPFADTEDVGDLLDGVSEENINRILFIVSAIRRYSFNETIHHSTVALINEMTGKEYEDILEAVNGYCETVNRRRQSHRIFCEKLIDIFVGQGLYEDYKAILAGIPYEDLNIGL